MCLSVDDCKILYMLLAFFFPSCFILIVNTSVLSCWVEVQNLLGISRYFLVCELNFQ